MVIGNPLNLDQTVTTGVVSAKGRSIGISDASFENFIQTDAAINFGNSGGPLLNMQGQVVGDRHRHQLGRREHRLRGAGQHAARRSCRSSARRGKVSRGYLGLGVRNLDYTQAQAWGLRDTDGALVQSVENGPAKDAGVQHGDVILAVDGHKVKQTRDLINYVSDKGPNATVTLDVWRNGKQIQKQVKLRERPRRPGRGGARRPQARGEQRHRVAGHPVPGPHQQPAQRPRHPARRDRRHRDQRHADQPALRAVRAAGQHHHRDQRPAHQGRRRTSRSVVKSAKPGSYLRFYALQFDPRGGSTPTPFFAVVQVPSAR